MKKKKRPPKKQNGTLTIYRSKGKRVIRNPKVSQMSKVLVLENWHPPYVTGDIIQDMATFAAACQEGQYNDLTAQFLFSHMLTTGEWEDAQVWWSPITQEEFTDESMIPDDLAVSLRPRWKHQQDFVNWCNENVPGFVLSTFWRRHHIIDKATELGLSLVEAVKIVAGLKCWNPPVIIQDVFEYDDYHTVIGYKPELARRLLPATATETLDEIEELPAEERLERVKAAACNKMRAMAVAIESGEHVRQVNQELKRQIYRAPTVKVIPCDQATYAYAVNVTRYDDDDNGYGDGDESTYYLRIISEEGEVLDDFPDDVVQWWRKKLGVKL